MHKEGGDEEEAILGSASNINALLVEPSHILVATWGSILSIV